MEHIGNQSNSKTSNERKQLPSIQLNSVIKPYKYMYQTIYKRANGLIENILLNRKLNFLF